MRASPELATLSPEVRDAAILKVLRAKKEEFMSEVWTVMSELFLHLAHHNET